MVRGEGRYETGDLVFHGYDIQRLLSVQLCTGSFPNVIPLITSLDIRLLRRHSVPKLDELRLAVNGETVDELEGSQALLKVTDKSLNIGSLIHTSLNTDINTREGILGTPNSTNGLTPSVTIDNNLSRTAGGVQCAGGLLSIEQLLSTIGDNDTIKASGVGGRVGLVNAISKMLTDDGNDEIVLLETLLESSGRGRGGAVVDGGKDTNTKRFDDGKSGVDDGEEAGGVVVVIGRIGLRSLETKSEGNALGDIIGHAVELGEDVLLDSVGREVGCLETHGVDEELLLDREERVIEQTRLRPVVIEGIRDLTSETTRDAAARGGEEATTDGLVGLLRIALVHGVRGVGVVVRVDEHLAKAITVVVVDLCARAVDGKLLEVGPTVTVELGVEVGEESTLQQRILAEVNAADDVARLEHDLLSLGEVVGRVLVQLHDAKLGKRHQLLGNNLGRIHHVEPEGEGLVLVHDLDGELPLGAVSGLDGIIEILAVEISVLASHDLGLLPDKRGLALLGLPVPLHQLGITFLSNETIGVDAEAVHVTEATGDAEASHSPEERVHGARLGAEEVPCRVVGRGSLGDLVVRLGLHGVNEVRELDGILDEEHGDVIADDIEVTLVGVEPGSETVDVPGSVSTTAGTGNGGEPDKDGSLLALAVQEGSSGEVGPISIRGESSVGTGTTRMDGPLRYLIRLLVVCGCGSTAKEKYIPARGQSAGSSVGK